MLEPFPMATDTRNRMIETTARLIQIQGLHGVSLSDILAASGAPRGSLYFHFPGGKEALVLEALRSGVIEASEALSDCLAAADHPADGIAEFFRLAARESEESGYAFGCPVAGIVLDRPAGESKLAQACQAALEEWLAMYREAFTSAGMAPDRAERLALTVLSSFEGALIVARSKESKAPIEAIGQEMSQWIAAALGTPARDSGGSRRADGA